MCKLQNGRRIGHDTANLLGAARFAQIQPFPFHLDTRFDHFSLFQTKAAMVFK